MRTKAGVAGHPLHPMLVTLPIGLWVFSFVADLIYLGTHDSEWASVAFYTMGGGLIGALAAAVPGTIDLFSITRGHVRRTGIWHMGINVTVLALFAINFWLRSSSDGPTGSLVLMSGVAIGLLGISGWLGGELVYRQGVAVEKATE